jgi:hypothetical protein
MARKRWNGPQMFAIVADYWRRGRTVEETVSATSISRSQVEKIREYLELHERKDVEQLAE